ncbi:hypothetical protein ABZ512_12275 [Nocardiopsis dassonvillei]|uniref:hypothetical protein n=1 Tax=Nocardiopsis dassonvillei TaxID=2014 RepID=UPI003404954F
MSESPTVFPTARHRRSELSSAVSDMRVTARWLTGAMASVGVVLLSAGSLTLPGQVDGVESLLTALAGILVGLCGVGLALWSTSEVLAPRVTVFQDLQSRGARGLRKVISRSPEDFYGPFGTDPETFAREGALRRRVVRSLVEALEAGPDADSAALLRRQLAAAHANLELHRRMRQDILEWVHAWQVRAALRRARWCVMGAALLVVVGIGLTLVASVGDAAPTNTTAAWVCSPHPEGAPVAGDTAGGLEGPCDDHTGG